MITSRHLNKLVALTCMALVAVVALSVTPQQVSAFSGSDFKPDRIIDDHIFFDANTMGVPDIQAFLNSKVPTCDTNGAQMRGGQTRAAYSASQGVSTPFTCLKDFQQSISGAPADQYCPGAVGAGT